MGKRHMRQKMTAISGQGRTQENAKAQLTTKLRQALVAVASLTLLAACSDDPKDSARETERPPLNAASPAPNRSAPNTPTSNTSEPNASGPRLVTSSLKPYANRPITDDIIYFLLPDRFANGDQSNDRGGLAGGPLDHGFDPTHKGFYHGGDLKGLLSKLDYLENMGVTAIWMAPIFKNKPVQGSDPWISAGYHGYWITDFTQIDPHFGTNEDLKALVKAAHSRNIKVIFDIITNHTADVIRYTECHGNDQGTQAPSVKTCAYRSKENYPYNTRGGPDGMAINKGFTGDDVDGQTLANFRKLTDMNYAYTPYVPSAERDVKKPAWLNDIRYYHNRGESTFKGESSLYGDFAGLDDLFTEHPDVVAGFTRIYKNWISEFKIDGFRIDTVRHVNDSFWQQLSPALIAHAKAEGIEEFYIFGEVYDPSPKNLGHFITAAKLPAVLDFGFQSAAADVLVNNKGTDTLKALFEQDHYYTGSKASALTLPTFLGNHDMGRLAMMINRALPDASPKEKLKRVMLGHALMFFSRGVPVIYSGDEQGFTGDGNDQDAREDMFPSKVAIYNDNILLGTDKNTAEDNFDQAHPLYREIKRLSAIYRAHPALRSGMQTEIASSDNPGLYAFTRANKTSTYLVLLNSKTTPIDIDMAQIPRGNWTRVDGTTQDTPGSLNPKLEGLSFAIYRQS